MNRMAQHSHLALPVLLAIFSSALSAQPAAELPQFEVASVKPTDLSTGQIVIRFRVDPGGRLTITAWELIGFIEAAFGLDYDQISGSAGWPEQIRYDVQAVPPQDSGIKDFRTGRYRIADERLRQMLQALLMTRFHLQFHWETKMRDVYLLKLGDKPPAFHPASVDPSLPRPLEGSIWWDDFRQWKIRNATMADLAREASLPGAPVLDKTGLSGAFDYEQKETEKFKWSGPDLSQEERNSEFSSAHHSSFLILLQELHLKLEKSKAPIEIYLIDHVEKPTAN
jgi:uncharacterized protein (TIGR03435 family)